MLEIAEQVTEAHEEGHDDDKEVTGMTANQDKGSWVRRTGRSRGAISAVIPLGLAVLFAGTIAGAQQPNFRAQYAGALTTTEIDVDQNEEEMARVSTGVGRGTVIGPFVFHEIRESEILEPDHPLNECDPGHVELVDVHWTLVMTDEHADSQLFFRLAEDQPHTFCLDPGDPPTGGGFRIHDLEIIGGTRRFESASGRVTVQCGGRPLAPGDPAGGPAHGAVSCTVEGFLDY